MTQNSLKINLILTALKYADSMLPRRVLKNNACLLIMNVV